MKNTFFLLFILLLAEVVRGQSESATSNRIKRFENMHSNFVTARNVDVWLPANYSEEEKYAVLYMQDGQMLFDSTATWNKQEWGVDETLTKLSNENKIKQCIVVGIWNGGVMRHSEYFPQKSFESLEKILRDSLLMVNRNTEQRLFAGSVQSDNYLKFIVTELKPFIDKTFSTRKDQRNTFIAGSSMGGLISLYAICEYPEVFGGAACLSTHWPGIFTLENNPIPKAIFNYLEKNLPDARTHKIYFDYGTETLDALYPPLQKQVDQIMTTKGYTSKNWTTKEFVGEDHSEKAWRKRLAIPILFLLGKE